MTARSVPRDARPAEPLHVALLGLGTVGLEVARWLTAEHSAATQMTNGAREDGGALRLVAVAERDTSRFARLDLGGIEQLDDAAALVGRPDIDVVVELIGGVGVAGQLVRGALQAGQAVVTANKALLAAQGAALERLARERRTPLRFEAAVGGAIPILATLAGDLAANRIASVRGIVNGSTNFVLTEMSAAGATYPDAIARAKGLGFLEADPSADVEGRDAAHKLAILIRLAFGVWPDVAAIRRAPPALIGDGPAGITGLSSASVASARRAGLEIKLLAWAARGADGGVAAWVLPAALPDRDPLAQTDGPENRIELVGEPVGRLAFVGPGAGGAPTSSAVVGDLLAIARGEGSTWAQLPAAPELADGLLVDDLAGPRRWLACDARGGCTLTDRRTLAALRLEFHSTGWSGSFLPILEEA